MIPAFINSAKHSCWPFWVLGLAPDCSTTDVEKAARDITAKLEFGIAGAEQFDTPEGVKDRDAFLVREAKALLQDPEKRLVAEFWYLDPLLFEGNDARLEQEDTAVALPKGVVNWQRALGVKF